MIPEVGRRVDERSWVRCRLDAIAFARNLGLLPAGARFDRLRGARTERATVLGHDASDEALSFPDAFHLEGNRIHGLIEAVEPVGELPRKRGHDGCASFPDAPTEGDGERK